MSDKSHYGFAILGTGAIAAIHAQAIKAIPNAKLIGVYNRTYSKAVDFSTTYRCEAFQYLEELLALPEVDIVCICTASGGHEELALKAISSRKHCLIEKPLEVTVAKCDRIISAAKQNNVQIGVIFPSRFYYESKFIKSIIERGDFGQLVIGSAYVKWNRTPEYYQSDDWRGTWQFDGGGALMNQGIHAIDMLQWYMGEIESVQSYASNLKHKNIEVEDTIVAVLKFKNGALGTIECSTAVYPGSLKKIEITGTQGSITLEDSVITSFNFINDDVKYNRTVATETDNTVNGGVSNPMAISFLGHQLQIEDFIDAIATKSKPLIDGEEGKKSVKIIEAIYESASTGKLIQLN